MPPSLFPILECLYYLIPISSLSQTQLILQKIPFEIQASSAFTDREQGRNAFMTLCQEAKQNGIQYMSLDEINAEIQKARYG